jgi:hypothetical protein
MPYSRSGTVFDPQTNIGIERLMDAESFTAAQEPTGLGIANAIQLELGAAQNGPTDPIQLSAAGALTINETGLYRIKLSVQFGRTGGAGTSELYFRVLVNGTQAGRSIGVKVANSNVERYTENDTWIELPAGAVLTYEVMRDPSGNDSGGVFTLTPTDEGVGTWNAAPGCTLRIERWIGK